MALNEKSYPCIADPEVKQFLQEHSDVLADPAWSTFFQQADVERARQSLQTLRAHYQKVMAAASQKSTHAAASSGSGAGAAAPSSRDAGGQHGAGSAPHGETRRPRSVQDLLTPSGSMADAVKAAVASLTALQSRLPGWNVPAEIALSTATTEVLELFRQQAALGDAGMKAQASAEQTQFLQKAATELHKLLELLIRFMARVTVPPGTAVNLRRFVDVASWFTKTLKAEIQRDNKDAFVMMGLMRVKHDRYLEETDRYNAATTLDIDVHVTLMNKLVELLNSYTSSGVPPAISAAAAAALPRPREPGVGGDRPFHGGPAAGGEPRPYRSSRPPYRPRGAPDAGAVGSAAAGSTGPGAAAAAASAGAGDDAVQQFRGKEGTLTRWAPHQHYGLITYDGVSTAFMPESQVPPAQRALLGGDAVVRFDGYSTRKSQQEGKLEARNVTVVKASPHPGPTTMGRAAFEGGVRRDGERRGPGRRFGDRPQGGRPPRTGSREPSQPASA